MKDSIDEVTEETEDLSCKMSFSQKFPLQKNIAALTCSSLFNAVTPLTEVVMTSWGGGGTAGDFLGRKGK